MSDSVTLEGLRRADGRIALFDGDAFVGYLAAPDAPTPRAARKAVKRKPGKRTVAAPASNGATGARGRYTGILRRCETCSAPTKRTICPNGHRVANDPE